MNKWEDIVKDRLEGYESTIPDGSFAGFRALRKGKTARGSGKVVPWIFGMTAAAAAILASVLFLRHEDIPQDGIQVAVRPSVPVVSAVDSSRIPEAAAPLAYVSGPVIPKAVHGSADIDQHEAADGGEETRPATETVTRTETVTENEAVQVDSGQDDGEPVVREETVASVSSPLIQEIPGKKPVTIRVNLAAAAAVGGGLAAAVLAPVSFGRTSEVTAAAHSGKDSYCGGYTYSSEPGGEIPSGDMLSKSKHYIPFKGGLSVGIPISERLRIASGLEYSLYRSHLTWTLSGEKKQYVHYLGVPLRLDWMIVSGRWLDVYLGTGVQGDFCLGATLDGKSMKKDAPAFSLLGAGGMQFNLSRRVGLYAEPGISWTVLSGRHKLETYRSEHPVVFSVSTGLRVNLGK